MKKIKIFKISNFKFLFFLSSPTRQVPKLGHVFIIYDPMDAWHKFGATKYVSHGSTNFLPQPQSIFAQNLKIGDFWRVAAQPHLHVLTHDYFSRTVLSVYFRGRDAKFFIFRRKKKYTIFCL